MKYAEAAAIIIGELIVALVIILTIFNIAVWSAT